MSVKFCQEHDGDCEETKCPYLLGLKVVEASEALSIINISNKEHDWLGVSTRSLCAMFDAINNYRAVVPKPTPTPQAEKPQREGA